MCIKFSLNTSKTDFENIFGEKIPFQFNPIKDAFPFKKYPVYTEFGFVEMTWGDPKTKIIHKRKSDIKNYQKGVLPITGFYIFKKEKIIAPIGFGDHKETLKIQPFFVSQKEIEITKVAVLYQNNIFFIIVDEASEKIKQFQSNEPLVLKDSVKWLANNENSLFRFSNIEIEIKPV